MPANAGIQNILKIQDPGVRRDDGKNAFRTFYGPVILNGLLKILKAFTAPTFDRGKK